MSSLNSPVSTTLPEIWTIPAMEVVEVSSRYTFSGATPQASATKSAASSGGFLSVSNSRTATSASS